jgi:hypothetical protein
MNLLGPIAKMVCKTAIESNNLWTNTQQTDTVTEVAEDQKKRFLQHLGVEGVSARGRKRKRESYKCMLTKSDSEAAPVVMAHIVPKRSKLRLLYNIGMKESGIRDVRNCLLLVKGIEEGFDQLRLSFIKLNPLKDRLYLKIWDPTIRNVPIYHGATRTIGSYEGKRLMLGEDSRDPYKHQPFRRALSYQTYMAYLTYKHMSTGYVEPEEFGSDHETEYCKQRELLKRAVIKDIEEEIGEENDQGNDSDA